MHDLDVIDKLRKENDRLRKTNDMLDDLVNRYQAENDLLRRENVRLLGEPCPPVCGGFDPPGGG